MIMLSYGVMQFVSAPLLGALSDRYGRRPVLLAGICGLSVMFAVPAFFASLTAILASRIAGGMLSANMAVAQAYVADLTTGYERSAAFGKIGATFGIGFVVGPALGGILGQNDPTIPFVVASAVTLITSSTDSLPCRSRSPIRTRGPCPLRQAPPLPRLRRCCASQERAFSC